MESEARLAAVRTENKSESLREARLAADVERVIVARDNKIESLRYNFISEISGCCRDSDCCP